MKTMCGIWCCIGDQMITNDYESFYQKLEKRGPDDSSIVKKPNLIIVFYRLSIMDISKLGMQPFIVNIDKKTYYLICNGEIYNHQDIKKNYNLKTKSDSDCEVILHLFLHFEGNFLRTIKTIKGEFAFVLLTYDQLTNNIQGYAARDPYGVRPLFFGTYGSDELFFSSIVKGIPNSCSMVKPFPPGKFMSFHNQKMIFMDAYYEKIPLLQDFLSTSLENIYQEVCNRLIHAVQTRIVADRPIGALLSGGLDSSIIVGIISKILNLKNIKYFSIGFDTDTPDLNCAKKVARHCNITSHHEIVLVDFEKAIATIDKVVECCESYDITTIRASTMQYLLAMYIRENSNIKVILNGDGADEVEMGYLYFYYAPTEKEAENENIRLLNDIYLFDGLRVDRTLGDHGLEARLPYLDVDYVEYYLSLPVHLRVPTKKRQEKQFIRDAFYYCYPDMLPKEIYYRQKEAFSDGVSTQEQSWHQVVQNYFETRYKNSNVNFDKYSWNRPYTYESFYYREKFNELFKGSIQNNVEKIIPYFWMPKFIDSIDPSARKLDVYQKNN